jgi:alcohol dehydrogenase
VNNFEFYSPTYFVFGKSTEEETGKYVKRFGGSKVLLHFGGGSVVRSGLLDRVKKSLDAEGIGYIELGGVKPNPRDGLVYEGIDICKKEGIDFVLAVGGGSVMDSAKAIAAGAVYDGDFWDFFLGKSIEKALPIGTVVTIAATGSEGSPDTIITKEEGMLKRAADGDAVRPTFSILNPELTMTLPAYQTACGITDIMSHVMERYFTRTKDVEITDRMGEGILLTMIKEAKRVMADPENYEARANIMWAGMVAHNNTVGVGRNQDWGTHHLEHELSALYDCAHGAGLAIMFPAWMKYVMKEDVMRFAQFAVRVWGCEMNFQDPEVTALEGIKAFEEFVKSIGMPTRLGEIGGKEEDISTLVKNMFYQKPNHGDFVKLTEESSAEIYKLAL